MAHPYGTGCYIKVEIDKKIGLIDTLGDFIIPPVYDKIYTETEECLHRYHRTCEVTYNRNFNIWKKESFIEEKYVKHNSITSKVLILEKGDSKEIISIGFDSLNEMKFIPLLLAQ